MVILTVMDTLLKRTHLMPTLSEAFEEAFMTFAVRLAMMVAGPEGRRPKGFDWAQIAQDGAFGAFASIFHGAFSNVGNVISKFFKNNPFGKGFDKDFANDVVSKVGKNDVRDLGGKNSHFSPDKVARDLGRDGRDFVVEGGSEAAAEFLGSGLFTGNWSTSWDTFLGAGISGKVENTLSAGAAGSGNWIRNTFGPNTPTSNDASDGGADGTRGGSEDHAGGTPGTSGNGPGPRCPCPRVVPRSRDPAPAPVRARFPGPAPAPPRTPLSHRRPCTPARSARGTLPARPVVPARWTAATHTGTSGPTSTSRPVPTRATAPKGPITAATRAPPPASSPRAATPPPRTAPRRTSTGRPSTTHRQHGLGVPPPLVRFARTAYDVLRRGLHSPGHHRGSGRPGDTTVTPAPAVDPAPRYPGVHRGPAPVLDGSARADRAPVGSTGRRQHHPAEHDAWRRLITTPDTSHASQQQLLDEIAAHRGGDIPSPAELDLRRAVHEQLASLPGVTVVVDDAANFGHQAAATMLMDSLHELGYDGRITVVAPESVQDRLQLLVPDAMNQRIDWRTGTFGSGTSGSGVQAGNLTDSLVLVAASDRLDPDPKTAKEFLDFVGADRAIVLKPYAWGQSHRLLYSRPGAEGQVTVHDLEDDGTGTPPTPAAPCTASMCRSRPGPSWTA
ncbi:hypothetical protein E4K10_35685 [Streptomyces sp. T1317-0309]|nr:hypothetical protein E4K10_35685 [Streptomyces sp. T1317-0309]